MNVQTCCFTGHRNIPQEHYSILSTHLETTIRALAAQGVIYFKAGGALGFDTLVEQTVLKLRCDLPQIRLILVLPCTTQAKRWNEHNQQVYDRIKAQADRIVYTSQDYTRDCMFKRNRYLVNGSDVCVCYLTKSKGGTAYTVGYAKSKGLQVINLADD